MGTGLRPRAKGRVKERRHAKFQGSQPAQILPIFGPVLYLLLAPVKGTSVSQVPFPRAPEEDAGLHPGGKNSYPQTLMVALCSNPTALSSFVMNWHMIISVLIVVAIKMTGVAFFLLYFPWIFGESNDSFSPTRSYGTVPQISGNGNISFTPTESSGTVCPRRWDFLQGRCFFLSTSEMSWDKSRAICEAEGSTLAIVNTPEKLYSTNSLDQTSFGMSNFWQSVKQSYTENAKKGDEFEIAFFERRFLQDITGAEKYFIGLQYQQAEKRWRWIDNSIFNGNVTNQLQSFNCVTMGLTKTFDAALCDTPHRWICDKPTK